MYIVSACLAGFPCRYDGQHNSHEVVENLVREGKAIPVCPEQLGGLGTPRTCAEQVGSKVIDQEGVDVTEAFEKGAQYCLEIAKKYGCNRAIMKAKSPSCGCGQIYDGTFSGKVIKGDGKASKLLKESGIEVVTEKDI